MPEQEPRAEQMHEGQDATAIPWSEVVGRLRDAQTRWLATTNPDGSPHVVPLWPVWMDGAVYFATGQGTRKEKNMAANPRAVITFAARGLDMVIEGRAAQVRDEATLQRVAAVYVADGWPVSVADGAFAAPFAAPTTGPAPYSVYEVTPTLAYAFGQDEEFADHPTRYRFY